MSCQYNSWCLMSFSRSTADFGRSMIYWPIEALLPRPSPPTCVVSTMRKWRRLPSAGVFEESSNGLRALEAAAPEDPATVAGAALYRDQCSAYHGSNGHGTAQLFPSLANSALVRPRTHRHLFAVLRGACSVTTSHGANVTLRPIFDSDTSSRFFDMVKKDEPLRAGAHDDAQCDGASRRRGVQVEERHRGR